MSQENEKFMKIAIGLALKARQKDNEPFGAILVYNGEIVMKNENEIHSLFDPTSHAELGLISKFCRKNKVIDLRDYGLYTSCEPCAMCAGAIIWSNLGKVVYSVSNDQLSQISGQTIDYSSENIFVIARQRPVVIKNILNLEGLRVFENYKFHS
ncbi:MAG: Guanine deaminase [Candidatus Heimdallarchaeota archaeon LC_3]|nr:MAG: Guanine deaminase [Candidatus Heimdallarchaeota archaeon LC_3]OLS21028.1 MAG: Guanine deaminase [Candidatus Heimdallarchaeota archaeon LC_3]